MCRSLIVVGFVLGCWASALARPAAAVLPDPSSMSTYTCVKAQSLSYFDPTYGSISARIYRPVAGACLVTSGPPAGRPLVLFFNGAGYLKTDYDYLADHLARNGYVVVVVGADEPNPPITCGGLGVICIEDRARMGVNYLRNFQETWPWAAQVDFTTLAIGGHSRGGEAAVEAARLIWEEEDSLGSPGVRAVFSLAPTDHGTDGLTGRRRLLGRQSAAFLVLFGSHDEQIIGYDPVSPPIVLPAQTGFALYDRAGREGSLEGFPISFDDQIDRSMQFINRANHEQFSDRCGTPIGCYPSVLACDLQHQTAKGYVNALLAWKIGGQTAYRAYLDASFDSPWTPAWPQWSAGKWSSRRVIDNFQDGELATDTLGGAVSSNGNLVSTVVDNGATDAQVPHGDESGQRLHVAVGAAGAANILQWSIPANRSNVSNFTHLSVRIGQAFSNVGTGRVHFRIQRGGAWSPLVASDSYGTLPDPLSTFTSCFVPAATWLEHGLAPMRTIKIPLSAFGGDLTSVTKVQIRFDDASTANEELNLDNLEFTGGVGLGEL